MSYGQRRVALIVFILLVAAAVHFAGRSEVGDVNSRVSRVESPCLKYGRNSKICQRSFEEALGTLTHAEACAVERKAGTLKAIRELAAELGVGFEEPCAGARLAQERKRGNERAQSRAGEPGGAGTTEPGQRGASTPSAPANSDAPAATAPAGGGSSHGAAPSHPQHPAPGGSAPETAAPPPAGDSPPKEPGQEPPAEGGGGGGDESSSPPPSTAQAPGLVEEVGGLVEDTGGTAGGVVESVGKTGCALLGTCK